MRELTKDERSLLLYLETCAVDFGGLVDSRHMNAEDVAIAKRWSEEGFLEFGRMAMETIEKAVSVRGRHSTSWVHLSDEALTEAHELRAARAKRMWENRTYVRTFDLREAPVEEKQS